MPGIREVHMAELMRLSEKTQTGVGIDTLFSWALAGCSLLSCIAGCRERGQIDVGLMKFFAQPPQEKLTQGKHPKKY